MENLKAKFFHDGFTGKLLINLSGNYCSNDAERLNLRIQQFIKNVMPEITIDMRSIIEIDETGIQSLLSVNKMMNALKIPLLILVDAPGNVASVIKQKLKGESLPVCFVQRYNSLNEFKRQLPS